MTSMPQGEGSHRFCYDSTEWSLSAKKLDSGGGGVKNCPKLCDVIFGSPLTHKLIYFVFPVLSYHRTGFLWPGGSPVSFAFAVRNRDDTRCQLHRHFMSCFCTRRSQKRKKTLMTWLSFCTFNEQLFLYESVLYSVCVLTINFFVKGNWQKNCWYNLLVNFTYKFFVQILFQQLFSSYMYVVKAAETMFVQKICM